MGSPSCPLCREPFVVSRLVKLYVDRPALSEQGEEDVELLQRLDAEEAKRQVELEAAVEQSKQRKRALRESLERARRLRKQREEEAEALKQEPPIVAEKSASGAVPSPREIDELRLIMGVTRRRRKLGWIARAGAPNADLTSSLVSSGAPPLTRGGEVWQPRPGTNAGLTSSLAGSTRAPRLSDYVDRNRSSWDGDEFLFRC